MQEQMHYNVFFDLSLLMTGPPNAPVAAASETHDNPYYMRAGCEGRHLLSRCERSPTVYAVWSMTSSFFSSSACSSSMGRAVWPSRSVRRSRIDLLAALERRAVV